MKHDLQKKEQDATKLYILKYVSVILKHEKDSLVSKVLNLYFNKL